MESTQDTSPAAKLSRLIVVGDRVLIKPKAESERTKTGLFLPPGVEEKEEIGWGWIMKIGPGYPIPIPSDESLEPWKAADERIKYVPLQAKVGDLAIFLKRASFELVYQDEKYFIVPQGSILMLERDEDLIS
jgi:chaperonin GroES